MIAKGTEVQFFRPGRGLLVGVTLNYEGSDGVISVKLNEDESTTMIHSSWVLRSSPEVIMGDLDLVKSLITIAGDDPNREGLLDTPERFIKAWRFWNSGYSQNPEEVLKVFSDGAEKYDQMIFQRDIPVWSRCEHHLAPFFGTAHIAYIPDGKIVGLSKIKRLVDIFSHRLQVQERLTAQIADALWKNLSPLGVGVVLNCRHTCMESRGIKTAGTSTITSALHGAIKDESSARAEFMSMVQAK